jgi:N6-adenosine-specific RNA methylase IME4
MAGLSLPATAAGVALRPISPRAGPYRVVLADPPWRFDNYSEKGDGRSPQRHYPCMDPADLVEFAAAVGLDRVLGRDCALLMWTTWPMLATGFPHRLMRGWGFEPKTGSPWLKTTAKGLVSFPLGKILRIDSELYLVGTIGRADIASHAVRGAIVAPATEHSRKPDRLYEIAEELWPRGPWIELFARRRRKRWDAYGDELGGFVGAEEGSDGHLF